MLLPVYAFSRVYPAIKQFEEGLGELFSLMKTHPTVMEQLFVDMGNKTTLSQLKSLYHVQWSSVGDNKKTAEEDSIYCWEIFLTDISCEFFCTLKSILETGLFFECK